MKLDRHVLQRSGVLAILLAGAWSAGCGAESPEVPDEDGGSSGMGTSGSAGFSGSTPSGGGAFPTTGGAGGTPSGGSLPTGGTPSGGTAGAFPTGGSAGTPAGGSGGTGTTCGQTVATAADTAIDNLEDGDNTISMPRVGYWYTYNDKSAGCSQTPAPDMGGANPFIPAPMQGNAGSIGARMTGMGCSTWGAGMGFDLANCNSKSGPYDATAFNGISFWYKSSTAVRVMVGNLQNIPPNDANAPGGTCADPADMCFNHHGSNLAAAPSGMTTSITFTTMSQEYGTQRGFLKNQIVNIQFQVNQMATTFDVVVDDLAFVP